MFQRIVQVELWLGEVEALMRDSLSTIMMKSLKAHHDPQAFVREKWLLSWPGQVGSSCALGLRRYLTAL